MTRNQNSWDDGISVKAAISVGAGHVRSGAKKVLA
jgi:hypothetical protein